MLVSLLGQENFHSHNSIRIQFQQSPCNCYYKIKNSSSNDLPSIQINSNRWNRRWNKASAKRNAKFISHPSIRFGNVADTRNRPRFASATLNRSSILKEETSYGSSIHGGGEGYSITSGAGRSVLWPRSRGNSAFYGGHPRKTAPPPLPWPVNPETYYRIS